MKCLVSLLLLAVVAVIAVDAYRPPVQLPHPNQPSFPTFPGHGPFNPRPKWPKPYHRFRRSPKDNQITANAQKGNGGSSWNVEAQHKIWENKHGSIHLNGGANKQPGGRPQKQVGIGGTFHWG